MYHVASSVRNPLRYGQLVDLVQSWFTDHPLYDADGQPIVVPDWSFPGRGRVQRQLRRAAEPPSATAERMLAVLPVRGERADLAARVEEQRSRAERALGYVELYGAYTETEAHFRIDRLLDAVGPAGARATRRSSASTRGHRLAPLRPRRPSPVGGRPRPGAVHARRRRPWSAGRDRAQSAILSPERHLAAFDLENTLDRLQRGRVLRLAGQPAPAGR